jgi:uncharacterized protein (TIRG00374 family)
MDPRVKASALLVVGIVVLGALVAYVGPREVVSAFTQASPTYLALAFVAYATFFLVRGIRWRMLFAHSAPDIRLSSTTSITAIGWLANSILPLKGGDVLRAALIARREKVALAQGASTVALERVLDMLGLAALAAVGLLLLPRAVALPGGLQRALALVWVLPILALAALAVLVRFRLPTLRLAQRLARPSGRVGERLVSFLDTMLSGLAALAQRPKLMATLVPMTVLVATTQALVFTFLVAAFLPGTPILIAFAGSTVFLLSFVVSITPGNVGTYEAAFVAVFVALGAQPAAAVPAAILTHITTTLTVAILGSVGLVSLGLGSSKVAWRPARVPQGGMP